MAGIDRFRLTSLRGKLGAAAFAGLLTTGLLTTLLLFTANAARTIVDTASHSQERSRVFMELKDAALRYQAASFQSVREPGPVSSRGLSQARLQLEQLLLDLNRVPVADAEEATFARKIDKLGKNLVLRFENPAPLVARVDGAWRAGGAPAALKEANRVSEPYYALRDTLQDEISRGHGAVSKATHSTEALIDLAVIGALAGLLLAFGFSATVQVLLQTRLHPGLTRLLRGAQAFGGGDLDRRIGLAGNDELAHLSNAFDAMAQTVAEKQEALRQVQLGLERAVEARTQQLQSANETISAADQRRRAFYAEISHGLRTPLTVIRGEAQVALRAADRPGFEPLPVFERILEQTQQLSRMVDDLFLIAQAQAGGLPLKREHLDLRELAINVASDFEILAVERGGCIRVAGGEAVFAFVDPDRVKRAMAALIENALVHCQRGVHIEVEIDACDEWGSIVVGDDGRGVDFSQADRLFVRFQRGDTDAHGTGLGLSLVSALVGAHGGRCALEPRPAGGTRVSMAFPLRLTCQEAA
jgi:signal transduction histidine kinase